MESRCVILDIGGVLEITPPTGWLHRWDERLGLPPGSVDRRLDDVWRAGRIAAHLDGATPSAPPKNVRRDVDPSKLCTTQE
ncbi:hypothetical protein [Streptomyces tauricus]